VIALDDAALARLVIGAGRVPRERRSRWLRSVALRFEGRPRSPGATRSARYRERLQTDEVVIPVAVNANDLAAALVGSGVLSVADAHDRQKLAQALGMQVRDWAAGWR